MLPFKHRHLLGISQLNQYEILDLLDRAEAMVPVSRQPRKTLPTLSGKTQINLFFEPSTRTQASRPPCNTRPKAVGRKA